MNIETNTNEPPVNVKVAKGSLIKTTANQVRIANPAKTGNRVRTVMDAETGPRRKIGSLDLPHVIHKVVARLTIVGEAPPDSLKVLKANVMVLEIRISPQAISPLTKRCGKP